MDYRERYVIVVVGNKWKLVYGYLSYGTMTAPGSSTELLLYMHNIIMKWFVYIVNHSTSSLSSFLFDINLCLV